MDGRIFVVVPAALCAGAAMSYWTYWVSWRSGWAESQREKELSEILDRAELTATGTLWQRLSRFGQRRQKWGAVGSGLAVALVGPVVLIVNAGDFTGAAIVMAVILGTTIGQATGALKALRGNSGDRIRVSALQPHGLSDYLPWRVIATEVGLAVLGWSGCIAGVAALSELLDVTWSNPAAGTLVFAAGTLAFVATTALVLQLRLAAAPQQAGSPEDLVVGDVVLAWSLRDLYFATAAAAGFSATIMWWMPDRSWSLIILYTAVVLPVIFIARELRDRRGMAPVAHRLTAAQGTVT